MYHENVYLILSKILKHTNLAATFAGFVAQLTCNNSIKECFYCQCEDCQDSIDFFVPPPDVADITINKSHRKFRSMPLLWTPFMI